MPLHRNLHKDALLTYKEVGTLMGISAQCVKITEDKALRKLIILLAEDIFIETHPQKVVEACRVEIMQRNYNRTWYTPKTQAGRRDKTILCPALK